MSEAQLIMRTQQAHRRSLLYIAAREVVGKERARGRRNGEIIEMAHAMYPGGLLQLIEDELA